MDFTTERGVTLELKAVSPVLLERIAIEVERSFRERGEPVDVPTYAIPNALGDVQQFVLTEDVLESADPQQTEMRKSLWAAHKATLVDLALAQEEARQKYLLTWGISFELPEDDSWIEMLEGAFIQVPDKVSERRWMYLLYYGLTPIELQRIMVELQVASYGKAVDPETVASFRKGAESAARGVAEQRLGSAI